MRQEDSAIDLLRYFHFQAKLGESLKPFYIQKTALKLVDCLTLYSQVSE